MEQSKNKQTELGKESTANVKKATPILLILIVFLGVTILVSVLIVIYNSLNQVDSSFAPVNNSNRPVTNLNKPEKEKPVFDSTAIAKMICPLMGKDKTAAAGDKVWSGDLGVTFIHQDKLYLMIGDTSGKDIFAPNVLATSADREINNCLDLNWQTQPDGSPRYFLPKIGEMDDPSRSTVPGGGISLNGNIYIFMQDITHWADWSEGGDNVTHACSVLIKSSDDGKSFEYLWKWDIDNKFVNIAPILGPHPSEPDKEVVYLVSSGTYRAAPVYLAYVEKENLENRAQYRYFSGWQNQIPKWSSNESEARSIVDNVKAGEISVRWNNYLNKYLLAFFDYNSDSHAYLRSAEKLWGPWSEPKLIYASDQRYDWYQSYITKAGKTAYWGTPYGFYLLPERFNKADDRIIYWVLSLWNPYNIFLIETDLTEIFE